MSFFGLQGAHMEQQLLRSLQPSEHPNIIRCLDHFEDSRHIVLVLEHMVADFRSVLMELTCKMTEE